MQKLKASEQGWKDSLELRSLAYKSAMTFLKQKQNELRIAKKVVYQTNKARIEAKKNLLKATRKRQGFISKTRQWTKHNYGKVFNKMEELSK